MKCPNCNQQYNCPCESCMKLQADKLPKWIRSNKSEDGNNWDETCPSCGLTKSVHDWENEEYRQIKELEKSQKKLQS